MADSIILLHNATILIHDDDHHVSVLRNSDILIEDDTIAQIGQNLHVPETFKAIQNLEIIDCTDCIISPGFISTHSHLWQSQLSGRFSNSTLFDYMPRGNFQGYNYTPSDMYWGQLVGCLGHVDAGTTTVLDHAHGSYTVEHVQKAIDATVDSGIRCVYAYAETFRLDKWDMESCVPSNDLFAEDRTVFVEKQVRTMNSEKDPKVSVGLAFDQWYLPKEMVQGIFSRMLRAGVKVFTAHVAKNAVFGMHEQVSTIDGSGVLDLKDGNPGKGAMKFVLSHCTSISAEDEALIVKRAPKDEENDTNKTTLFVSCTPETECQMGMQRGAAFNPAYTPDPARPNHQPRVSLGVDCHCSASTFMPTQGRLALQNARILSNDVLERKGKWPSKLRGDSEGVFNMITVNGASALGFSEQVGRIKQGYLADLVVFDATSPAVASAAQYDPLEAVVRLTDVRDVRDVIVDGRVRKRSGKLLSVDTREKGQVSWDHVRSSLLTSQQEIQKRIDGESIEKALELMVGVFHIDRSAFE